jgi:hypothetical protein
VSNLLSEELISVVPTAAPELLFEQEWTDDKDIELGTRFAYKDSHHPFEIQAAALYLELMARVRLIKKKYCE